MYHADNEKQKTTNDGRNRTTKSRKKSETYKFLRILEADNVKQAEMKWKFLKSMKGERENYTKLNYMVEISSKG